MAENLKVGLLGCGGIGKIHAEALAAIGRPLHAVADADPKRAEGFGKASGARALPGLPALMNECDAILVCTPPGTRADQVSAAAGAGKHVFAEKPLCLTLEEAGRIGKAVSASRGTFMIGYVLRFFPLFRLFLERFRAGDLGPLVSCWDRRFSEWPYYETAWLRDPAQSGGITVEFFTHDVDWLLAVGGFPERVTGWEAKAYPGKESGIADNVWATLEFARGTGVGGASWTSSRPSSALGILGTEGSLVSTDGGAPVMKTRGKGQETLALDGPEPFQAQMREFLACAEEGRRPPAGFAEARDALAVTLAIREAARTGAPAVPRRE